MLLEYFPASQGRLDAALAAGLAEARWSRRRTQGIRYGERVAYWLIELREDDGRNAPVTFDVPPAPGVWRPTPTAFAPFFDPWMAQLGAAAARFAQPVPAGSASRRSTSATYTEDFNEVKDVGSSTSTVRTPEQTDNRVLLSSVSVFQLVSSSMRVPAARYQMDISDSARLFAAVSMSVADGLIGLLGRQVGVRLLAAGHGDPAGRHRWQPGRLTRIPLWLPLLATPPYPDYTSGLTTIMGAATLRPDRSPRPRGGSHRREHHGGGCHPPLRDRGPQLNQDAFDARVWSGIHFRTADVVGSRARARK